MSSTSPPAPESSSTSFSNEYTKPIFHGTVARELPHICTDQTVSSSGEDDDENLISKNVSVVKRSCGDYATVLPFLSRLKQPSTHMVDAAWIKEDTMSDEHVEPSLSSSRQFSLPASFSEAVSHAKVSKEILYASQNRNKHLSHSDLSLSLGSLCSEPNFTTSGLASSFSVLDRRSDSLPFESVRRILAQQKRAKTPGSDHEENKAAPKRLKATEIPTAHLTIFYDGAVHTYNDVPRDRAKAIMLLAESANAGSSHIGPQSLQTRFATQNPISKPCKALNALKSAGNVSYIALPQARRISLQRFLRKRTERTQDPSPYAANQNVESGLALPRSRPSSPSATDSRAASPAALLKGSPCRPPAYGDYTCSKSGRSSPAPLTPLSTINYSNEVSITSAS